MAFKNKTLGTYSKGLVVISNLASTGRTDPCQITRKGDRWRLGALGWLSGTWSPWPQEEVERNSQKSLSVIGWPFTSSLPSCRPEPERGGCWGFLPWPWRAGCRCSPPARGPGTPSCLLFPSVWGPAGSAHHGWAVHKQKQGPRGCISLEKKEEGEKRKVSKEV